jgi:hypothetical protein
VVVSPGGGPPSGRRDLESRCSASLIPWHVCDTVIFLPSPTKNWYSGPVGVVSVLLVSIIGVMWPAPTAALYAACVGYRGGGGRTLHRDQHQLNCLEDELAGANQ